MLVFAATAQGALLEEAFAEANVWTVEGTLFGKGATDANDISGIACRPDSGFPKSCLVIDDNGQSAQRATVQDGRFVAGDVIPLITDRFDGKALELDGEGVAWFDGAYYVVGSHGHPRDPKGKFLDGNEKKLLRARIRAASQIIRIPDDAKGASIERSDALRRVLQSVPALAEALDARLEDNGLTIEGISIHNGFAFIGFRGPVRNGHAPVLAVRLEALFGTAEPEAKLYWLRLGHRRGIRDLALFGDTVLILAGPSQAEPGSYAIYGWNGESDAVTWLGDLDDVVGKKGKRKAEALLPLDVNGSLLRVLALIDGKPMGAPVETLINRP